MNIWERALQAERTARAEAPSLECAWPLHGVASVVRVGQSERILGERAVYCQSQELQGLLDLCKELGLYHD